MPSRFWRASGNALLPGSNVLGPASGGAFTPASITGLDFWLEADPTKLYTDAGTTLVSADGQAVQQANDKSGNARHTSQATSTKRPLYRTGSGKPYLEFDGTDDALQSATDVSWVDGTGQHWLAVSLYLNNLATLQYFGNISGAANLASVRISTFGEPIAGSYNDAGALTDDFGAAFTATTPVVLIMTVTSGAVEMFVDNSSAGSTALTGTRQTNVSHISIGGLNAGANFMGGRIYGIAHGSGTLSSTDRGNLQTYLAGLHP